MRACALLFFSISLSAADQPSFIDFEGRLDRAGTLSEERGVDRASQSNPFSQEEDEGQKPVYSYDKYFNSVMPDVAVRIGRKTVQRWSHQWLYKEDLPVRFIRYDIVGDSLEFNITVDYQYFRNRQSIDVVSPAYAPGEIFKPVGNRKPFDRDKDESSFVVDLRFRLRFPLVDYQNPQDRSQDNTLYMQFTRQAIQAYYLADFNTYLGKLDEKAEMVSELEKLEATGINDQKLLEQNLEELEALERKLGSDGALSKEDERRLDELNTVLKGGDLHMLKKEKILAIDGEIERFQSGSILPFVPSNEAIKDLLDKLSSQKAFSNYLAINIHEYQGLAGGIIKISGMNRIIEGRFPGLDIYFVGIDRVAPGKINFFGTEDSKILVAGRMRK